MVPPAIGEILIPSMISILDFLFPIWMNFDISNFQYLPIIYQLLEDLLT